MDLHTESSQHQLLYETFAENALRYSSRTALRCAENEWTYGDLHEIVGHFARGLVRLGLRPGDRIAAFAESVPEVVCCALAAMKSGIIFVPINPLLRPQQVCHILNDSSATAMLAPLSFVGELPEPLSLRSLRHVIVYGGLGRADVEAYESQIVSYSELIRKGVKPGKPEYIDICAADPATLFYTSGSTGLPKGVIVSHKNLADGARIVSNYLSNSCDDVILGALPLSFDYGFSQLTTSLHVGACVVLLNSRWPRHIIRACEEHKVTGLAGVPTLWKQLVDHKFPPAIAKTLRYITNSGGSLPRSIVYELATRLPDTQLFLMYGLTESFRSTFLDPTLVDKYPDSIGSALPGVQIHVINSSGRPCQSSEPGELVHSGALVSLGYWNNPRETAKRFRSLPRQIDPDGSIPAVWTGDIVRRTDDGLIYFIGRNDEQIKCSGYRISPEEIEKSIVESGHVSQAVALGLPDKDTGQRIAVAVLPKCFDTFSEADLRRYCSSELPPFMQPELIQVFSALPLTSTGKPDRQAIKKLICGNNSSEYVR